MDKVLIIGPRYFNFIEAVRGAFGSLGWEASVCPYDNPVHPYTGFMKVRWKVSCRKDILLGRSRSRYNEYLKYRFRSENPQMVFIMNGDMVLPDTLDFFRQNGAKVALWMFDSISRLPSAVGHIDHVDALFCFDRGDIGIYARAGKTAYFLPQACDTAIYRRLPDVRKDIDILFIGNMYRSPKRKKTLLSVIKAFPDRKIVVFGQFQPWYKGFMKWLVRPYRHIFRNSSLSPEKVNLYYNRAKVVLNIHQESQTDGANPRVFEISGAGAYQICDANPYLESLFHDGEIALYRDIDGLIEEIGAALSGPDDIRLHRSRMAEKAVRQSHSFRERAAYVLSVVFPSPSEK